MSAEAALSPTERRRLVSILGMLGSDHDGERAAAAALASRLVRDRGLTWESVIPAGGVETARTSSSSADGGGWRIVLAFCQRHRAALSEWEQTFVTDLQAKRTLPTPRQVAKVAQIADVLRTRGLS